MQEDFGAYLDKILGTTEDKPESFGDYLTRKTGKEAEPLTMPGLEMAPSHKPYKDPGLLQNIVSDAGLVGKSLLEGGVGALEGAAETAFDLAAFIPSAATSVGASVFGGHAKGREAGAKVAEFISGLYDPTTDAGHMAAAPVKQLFEKVGSALQGGAEAMAPGDPETQAAGMTAAEIALILGGGYLKGKAKTTYAKVLNKVRNPKQVKIILGRSKTVPPEIKSIIEKIPDTTPIDIKIPEMTKPRKPNIAISKEQLDVFKKMPDDMLNQMAERGVEGAKIEVVERQVAAKAEMPTEQLRVQHEGLGKEITSPVKQKPERLEALTDKYIDTALELNKREPGIVGEAYVDKAYQEVVSDVKAKKQAGFVGAKEKATGKSVIIDPEIDKIFKERGAPSLKRQIVDKFKINTEEARRMFVYESTLKEQPQFKNDVRLFQDVVWDAVADKNKKIVATIGKIAHSNAESKSFRTYVTMKSFEGMGEQGKSIPYGLTLDQVKAELANLESRMTPGVKDAVAKHKAITRMVLEDLVARGKLPKELLAKDDLYFPHIVLDYNPEWTRRANIPKRFQQPFRGYTKKRVGTKKAVDLDYVAAMGDLYQKVYIDNAIDNFMESSVKKYDFTKSIPKKRAKEIFGKDGVPKPRRIYEIDGKEYQGYQYKPGNAFYPTEALNEALWQRAIDEGLSVAEFMETTGPQGGKPIRTAIALGGKHKSYLLPKEIAMRLEDFRSPAGDIPLFWNLRNATSFWKRMTLDFAGIPFQIGNIFGDLINLWKTDPAAFTKLKDSFRVVLNEVYNKGELSSELGAAQKIAKEQRVSTTHFFSEIGVQAFDTSVLRQFQNNFAPANYLGSLLEGYEKLSIAREGIPRGAKLLKDLERIHEGKSVVAGEIDVKGLDNISAAGKVAREFTVDYGAVPQPYKRFLRGWLTPFLSFHDFNMRNWVNYAAKNPGDLAVKFIAPAAAMWAWNNTGERRETEEGLGFWRYLPHVNTGYKTREGKDIIVAMQTPFEMAAGWFGLDRLPAKITDVRSGKLTAKEAAVQQLKDIGLGAPRQIFRLLNPMIQVMQGMESGKDPYSRQQIVPSRFKGTKYEKRYWSEFVLGKLLTPYGQFMRVQSTAELDPDIGGFGQWLLKGPLDVVRAIGIRKVDLDRYAMSEGYGEKAELTNDIKNKLAILEHRFIKANMMKNSEESEKYWSESDEAINKLGGAWPTADQITNRLFGYDVQMELARRALGKTKDNQLRQDIKDYIESLRELKYVESMTKNSLQVIRPELYEKAFEWMKKE